MTDTSTTSSTTTGTGTDGLTNVQTTGTQSGSSVVTVNSTSALVAALKSATSGEVITLAPGTYPGVVIQNLSFASGAVTITSADPANPAVLEGLKIYNDRGLTFSDLTLSSEGVLDSYAFRVKNSIDVAFEAVNVHGSMDGNPGDDINGFYISGSRHVTIANSTFQQLANAISDIGNVGVNISGNAFHDIRSDGIDNAGSSNVVISANTFTDFYPNSSLQHPDAIQFWTTNTTASASNITITGNLITRGKGYPVQGIFLRDQTGHLPYQNVNISQNTVLGALYNGIYVTGADNATVHDNLVAGYSDQKSWIRLDTTVNATVTDNTATSFQFDVSGANPNVGMTDIRNMTIPAFSPASGASLYQDMVASVGFDMWRLSNTTSPLLSLAS